MDKLLSAGIMVFAEEMGTLCFVHYVGYPKKPTPKELAALKQELFTSVELGFHGRSDLIFCEAPSEIIAYFNHK